MRWWPNVRAGLIGLVMLIGLLDGCPMPTGKQRARMPAPVGDSLDDLDEVRVAIVRRLRPVRRLTNIQQKWNLFRGAGEERNRMWIEARAGVRGEWELLYRVLDDDHTFMVDQLAYRRLRGAWNPRGSSGPRGAYQSFVTWIAGEVFRREARFTDVRVRMEIIDIGDSGGYAPTGKFRYEAIRRRSVVEAQQRR